jgi:hypothetical protein
MAVAQIMDPNITETNALTCSIPSAKNAHKGLFGVWIRERPFAPHVSWHIAQDVQRTV